MQARTQELKSQNSGAVQRSDGALRIQRLYRADRCHAILTCFAASSFELLAP